MVFAYWLLMPLASLPPLVGVVIAPVLVPAFSVGFMAAARAVGSGQRLELALLFEGFRPPVLRTQLFLRLAYLPCLAFVLSTTTLAYSRVLARWMAPGAHPREDAPQTEAF